MGDGRPLAEQGDRAGIAEFEILDRRELVSHHLRGRADVHPGQTRKEWIVVAEGHAARAEELYLFDNELGQ